MPRMFVESEGGVRFKRGGRRREACQLLERDLEVVLIRLCRFWRP
jgi:hypothetical protein